MKHTKGLHETGYVFSVDHRLIIKTWDLRIEGLFHKSGKAVIGEKIHNVFPMLSEKIALVFTNGKKIQIKKLKNICSYGTNFSADIQLNPVRDKKRNVKEVSVILRNITTECPLHKKLNDSEKMIAIGKVASTLAHGVRNPLNAIKGAVVYITEKYGNEPTLQEFSKIINDEIGRLDSFISSFLSTARREKRFILTNLNDILTEILIMIKPRNETQDIKTSFQPSVLPLIMADPFQMEQALFNIINNAIEAMPSGGLMNITTSLTCEGDISYAVVEISDTGRGIPKKDLTGIGRLSSNPGRNDKGFGIFLSREIIKSHNGKLFWESAREKGTTFRILLPLTQDE